MTATIIEFKHRAPIRAPVASAVTAAPPRRFNPLTGWPVAGDGVLAAINRVMRPFNTTKAAIDRALGPLHFSIEQTKHLRKLIEGPLYVRT